MILLDERTQVKKAINLWMKMYGTDRTYGADNRGRKVGEELLALNQETATAKDIAAIIGNEQWAYQQACDECGKTTWDIVEFGDNQKLSGETFCLCAECLQKGLEVLNG